MTTTSTPTQAAHRRPRQLSAEASALWEKFPPRPIPDRWEATCQDRATVLRRLLAPPFTVENSSNRYWRKLALIKILDWLEGQPGASWQQRWNASGAGLDGRIDW